MSKPKVYVTRKWPSSVEEKLKALYDVTLNTDDRPLTADEFKSALKNFDAVCPSVCDAFPADVINTADKRCKILGNFGVGFNHIDIQAAKANNIVVTNTPGVLTESTADLAMTLLLMSARRGAEGDRQVRAGQWTGWCPTHMLSSDVTGATLGLIGFGRIAIAMARKAHHGFGMKIIYFSPRTADQSVADELKAERCATLPELLAAADYVSLHCPGSPETRHLINADSLKLMKPSAHLINTARGDVVDSQALIDALQHRQIAGAGLDVYEGEPNINPGFLTLDNVTLLPHLGSATLSTRTAMGNRVLANLADFFGGKEPQDRVV
ncbi:MAG: D-glycerate dehydrogenase [Methylicorpusculum sp.]|uniref:2-hydroxyacid dehydrogenase n=1 Tax=Methylicorpusculum sp. TaxID=2713644 RepID=UPI0027177A3B|nr:D-glycerate dehydrogenase [Methylicorpusculum sp.]MDO8941165.1 D-glycerate dehydrogenase [Methylicorpusculum sp.]MDO9240682.1 D-glycerate dehydrogenase [Methylicorpusculum sp.]MDP2201465.1 D-glycerate dehydrogenase [Methylicorpusculum sp.]